MSARWKIALVTSVATFLFLILVWGGLLRLEVPHQHWFYYDPVPFHPAVLVPFACLALLAGTLGWALSGLAHRRWRQALFLIFLCACGLVIGTRSTSRMGFTALLVSIVSDGSNSYFNTAVDHPEALALAREYPARMPQLRLHAATQSPGVVLLHAVLRRWATSSAAWQSGAEVMLWLWPGHSPGGVAHILNAMWNLRLTAADISAAFFISLLFPLLGVLGLFPVFGLARRIAGLRAALLAAGLYATTPSLIWFTASVDQIYPALAALVAWLLYQAGRRPRLQPLQLLTAGLCVGVGLFLNFGFVVVAVIGGLLCGALSLRPPGAGTARAAARLLLARGLLYGGGILAVLACVQVGLGLDLLGAARVSSQLRTRLYGQEVPRPWLTWVLLNPVEWAIGLGFSSVALMVAAVVLWWRGRGRLLLLGVTLLTLLLLDLSGVVRAEWSRMLLWAMPLGLAGAAGAARRLRLTAPGPALTLLLAQGLYALLGYQLFDVWGQWVEPFR